MTNQKQAQVYQVVQIDHDVSTKQEDLVAVEAPLTIRYAHFKTPEKSSNLVTLLRTPINDIELTAGFLFAESYYSQASEIELIHYCEEDDAVDVISHKKLNPNKRNHLMHSGCGSCSLENIQFLYQNLKKVERFEPSNQLIKTINETISEQPLFAQTGGTHATYLLDENGSVLSFAEDVGRHNALDKAIGKLWLSNQLKEARVAWVSGRLGFELVQKAINADISCVISVGAPTSLAIDFAKQFNLCTIGFNRNSKLNIYS